MMTAALYRFAFVLVFLTVAYGQPESWPPRPWHPITRGYCRPNYDITPCVVRADNCFSDRECGPAEKCCSQGCGRTCQNVTRIPCPRIDQVSCPVSKCRNLGGYAEDADGCHVCRCKNCPNGPPTHLCKRNPCQPSRCPAHPRAKCVPNYCSGCKAEFYVNGERVDCQLSGNPTNAPSCGANEEFKACGTACEPTCNLQRPRPCIELCRVNVCQCKAGFVRGSNGKCVRPFECPLQTIPTLPPRKCKVNEVFRTCGTACEPTCNQPRPRVCTEQCILNVCQCRIGYVRDENGQCVRLRQCPAPTRPPRPTPTCRENEVLQRCGTACEPSCAVPNRRFCTKQCIVNVCQCKPGFLRHPNGRCVQVEQCPLTTTCPRGVPQVRCFRDPCRPPPACPAHPTASCHSQYCGGCNTEFHINNRRVNCSEPVIEIPSTTEPPPEEGSCVLADGRTVRDGERWNNGPCSPCRCHNGMAVCTAIDCPPPPCANPISIPGKCCQVCPTTGVQCHANESYSKCGTPRFCEATCRNLNPGICRAKCEPGCKCKSGYVRDSTFGRCIRRCECPGQTCGGTPQCLSPQTQYQSPGPRSYLKCNFFRFGRNAPRGRRPPVQSQRRHPDGCYCKAGYGEAMRIKNFILCLSIRSNLCRNTQIVYA